MSLGGYRGAEYLTRFSDNLVVAYFFRAILYTTHRVWSSVTTRDKTQKQNASSSKATPTGRNGPVMQATEVEGSESLEGREALLRETRID